LQKEYKAMFEKSANKIFSLSRMKPRNIQGSLVTGIDLFLSKRNTLPLLDSSFRLKLSKQLPGVYKILRA
jgi:hypothetical protein